MTENLISLKEMLRREASTGLQRRAFPARFEVRSVGEGGRTTELEGYATVYERSYEMWDRLGKYDETVRSGAGKKTLSENPQTQLLLNHTGLSMAYTRNGTLQLSEDTSGLHWRARVNVERHDVSDMVTAIRDGDIDECSFSFTVPEGRSVWSEDMEHRTITEYSLHRGDVAVVNFGANPATAVTGPVDSRAMFNPDALDEADARELLTRLQQRFAVEPPATRGRSVALALAELDLY